MFRHGPAPAIDTMLSRGMAVDNIVDNYGTYPHAPHSRLTGVWRGLGVLATLPPPMPGKCRHGPGNGVAAGCWTKKTPRMAGQEKTPRVTPWGWCGGGLRRLFQFAQQLVSVNVRGFALFGANILDDLRNAGIFP